MAAFEPILGSNPKVLILGSMPSKISLFEKQYYANPRNAFWWIMSEILQFDLRLDYARRSKTLTQSGIAVWDVLYDCERPGSLDSAIVKASEVANDFDTFFAHHGSLTRVVFNGIAAERIFKRHHRHLIQNTLENKPTFQWHRCPSTSPAHASMTKHDKLKVWRKSVL